MVVDIIFALFIVIAILKGLQKGLIVAVFSFIAFIIGIAAALKLSAVVAVYLQNNTGIQQKWLPVLSFIIVFLIVILLARMLSRLIEKAMQEMLLGWLNKLGGIIFYALLYSFILSVLLFYAVQIGMIKETQLVGSMSYSFLKSFAPKIIQGLSYVLPFLKNVFSELENFFSFIAQMAS